MHLETRQPDRTDLCEPDGALAMRPIALPTPGGGFPSGGWGQGRGEGSVRCGRAGVQSALGL